MTKEIETKFVHVEKAFKLQRDTSEYVDYAIGPQHMLAEDADHWYTKLHLKGSNKALVPGSADHAAALVAQHQATLATMQEAAAIAEAEKMGVRKGAEASHLTATTQLVKANAKQSLRIALKKRA